MSQDFATILRQRSRFTVGVSEPPTPPRDPQRPCEFAVDLQAFCDELVQQLDDVPSNKLERKIAEAKVNLVDRYADFLADAPHGHVNAAGQAAHRCIDDVFKHTVGHIRRLQRLRLPPKFGFADPPLQERPNPVGIRLREPDECGGN
jgi:hypothetical protein